jgi:galactokinase
VVIDFGQPDDPSVEKMQFDLDGYGFALVIVDTGGNHANLTEDYAAVRREMREVSRILGHEYARQIEHDELMANNRRIRNAAGDRAFLRVLHFIEENRRVVEQAAALKRGDFREFLSLVRESGNSSYKYLQNAYSPHHVGEQGVSLALALTEKYLRERGGRVEGATVGEGACRVHGGGFAGTIQVFLPAGDVDEYAELMERFFGPGSTQRINLREAGTSMIARLQLT